MTILEISHHMEVIDLSDLVHDTRRKWGWL